MKPLTGKELEYLADCMSNEDLLIKQAIISLTHVQNPAVQQLFTGIVKEHQKHYQTLLNTVQQHASIAPNMS
ncbi:hypothetical protein [Niallia sp. NCCP-28]|uniref:hypothetical protein n=1 Tax=Niallia sp. NCCP-28 TaxID=2934712 RepID=UPI002089493D|nr:hypothetical protein [Niallia sp. NCCP-28]GKU83784.1 hypothetical protein NCCP28_31800 [Niallia sp. NCCP-28]